MLAADVGPLSRNGRCYLFLFKDDDLCVQAPTIYVVGAADPSMVGRKLYLEYL